MKPKPGDFLIAALIIIFSFAFFLYFFKPFNDEHEAIAIISQNGNVIKTINLSKITENTRQVIEIDGEYHAEIIAEKGRIRFDASDCPDKVCVYTGWITRQGSTAVCLPNKVIIKIESSHNDVDIIVS